MFKHTFTARWSFSAKKAGVFQAHFTEHERHKNIIAENKHHPDVSGSSQCMFTCVIVEKFYFELKKPVGTM